MTYTRAYSLWKDFPDTSTPILASTLQRMEDGIVAAITDSPAVSADNQILPGGTADSIGFQNNIAVAYGQGAPYVLPASSTPVRVDRYGHLHGGMNYNLAPHPRGNTQQTVADFLYDQVMQRLVTRSIMLTQIGDPPDYSATRFGPEGGMPYGKTDHTPGTYTDLTGLGAGISVLQIRGCPAATPYNGTPTTPGGIAEVTAGTISYATDEQPRYLTPATRNKNLDLAVGFRLDFFNTPSGYDGRQGYTQARLSAAGNWILGWDQIRVADNGARLQIRNNIGINEQFTLNKYSGTTLSGTFTLTWYGAPPTTPAYVGAGETTGPIPYNATPAQVATALQALTSIGAGTTIGNATSANVGANGTVTGSGTTFMTDLVVNDWITIAGNDVRVASISSNTAMTVFGNPGNNGSAIPVIRQNVVCGGSSLDVATGASPLTINFSGLMRNTHYVRPLASEDLLVGGGWIVVGRAFGTYAWPSGGDKMIATFQHGGWPGTTPTASYYQWLDPAGTVVQELNNLGLLVGNTVTQTAGNNTTKLASTAFVTAAVAAGGGGGAPTGPAGGDMAGSYPNPTIKSGVSLTNPAFTGTLSAALTAGNDFFLSPGAHYHYVAGDQVFKVDQYGHIHGGKNLLLAPHPRQNEQATVADFLYDQVMQRFMTRSISMAQIGDPADITGIRFGPDSGYPYAKPANANGTYADLCGIDINYAVAQFRSKPGAVPYGGDLTTTGAGAEATSATITMQTTERPRYLRPSPNTSDVAVGTRIDFQTTANGYDSRQGYNQMSLSQNGNLLVGRVGVYLGDNGSTLQVRADYGQNETLSLAASGTLTAGTFTLTHYGVPPASPAFVGAGTTTSALNWNATAAQVQLAYEALAAFSTLLTLSGNFSVAGGAGAVTGIGTAFRTELCQGDVVTYSGASYTVASIASNTSMVLTGAPNNAGPITGAVRRNVYCTGGPINTTPITVQFCGAARATHYVRPLVNNTLTGGTVTSAYGAYGIAAGAANPIATFQHGGFPGSAPTASYYKWLDPAGNTVQEMDNLGQIIGTTVTQAPGTNTTALASTAFVTAAMTAGPTGTAGGDLSATYPNPLLFGLTSVISPSTLTADQNDWAPGLTNVNVIRVQSTPANVNITGLAGGTAGKVVHLTNANGAQIFTLKQYSGLSIAANRFAMLTDLVVAVGATVTLRYDSSTSAWRVLAYYGTIAESYLSLSDVTTANASSSAHGLLPKLDANAAHYLDGTGAWTTPAGGGGSPTGAASGDLTGSYPGPTLATNIVSNTKFRQGIARSVVGVTGNATANVADIQSGGNDQFLVQRSSALTFATLLDTDIPATLARLASPALTGTPTAPTASPGTATTQIATTAFVSAQVKPGNLYLGAASIWPSITSGASANTQVESATNKVNVYAVDFADAVTSYAESTYAMPSDWNGGTITAQFVWMANDTTTNAVMWGIQGRAYGDGDLVDQAFGTAVTVTDANASTANQTRISAATAAVTIAGTPAASKLVQFRIERVGGDASDTLANPARLLGVMIFYTRV